MDTESHSEGARQVYHDREEVGAGMISSPYIHGFAAVLAGIVIALNLHEIIGYLICGAGLWHMLFFLWIDSINLDEPDDEPRPPTPKMG